MRPSTLLTHTLLLLTFCACGGVAAEQTPSDSDLARLADERVQFYVRQNKFTGAVLVARKGEPVFRKAYGMADREWDVPNTPETKFRLGSIRKQFTAALILRLEEQGKISLEDPVSKYYPDAPKTWAKITIHHLLTTPPVFPATPRSPTSSRNTRATR